LFLIWDNYTSYETVEYSGKFILRRQLANIDNYFGRLEDIGENRTIVSVGIMLIAVFYWVRRQDLFFVISAFAGLAMAVMDFVHNWKQYSRFPGDWVWCAGYLLLVLSAIKAFTHFDDEAEYCEEE
jgi:hypothetical protein